MIFLAVPLLSSIIMLMIPYCTILFVLLIVRLNRFLEGSRDEAVVHLTSDQFLVSDYCRENLLVFNASKVHFFILQLLLIFQMTLFFSLPMHNLLFLPSLTFCVLLSLYIFVGKITLHLKPKLPRRS